MLYKDGAYPDIDINEYHDYNKNKAVSSSGIIDYKECPYNFKYYYILGKKKFNKFMQFGDNAHISLLEPEVFNSLYRVADKAIKDKRLKAWKEFDKVCLDDNRRPLLFSEYQALLDMRDAILENKVAVSMLTSGVAETSFFATHESGLQLRGRPDLLVNHNTLGNCIVDYKTTGLSLNLAKQSTHMFNMYRPIQAATHKYVVERTLSIEINNIVYIVQSINPPYYVRLFNLPYEAISFGESEVDFHLSKMAESIEKDNFPKYSEEIEDLIIPSWLVNNYYD